MGVASLLGAGVSAYSSWRGRKDARKAAARQETAAREAAERQAQAASQAGSFISDAALQGSQLQAQGYNTAADQRVSALQQGMAGQREMFDRQNALQQPFINAGLTGQNRYMELMGLGGNTGAAGYGKYGRDPTQEEIILDPGYQFRQQQGQQGMERSAAARAGLQSGAALKAAARYNQDFASNEYGNAFDRYQTNRSNQLSPLQLLMAQGQNASNVATNVAGQYGNALYRGNQDIGNARGEGTLGAALANAGGLTESARARAAGLTGNAGFLSGGQTDAANAYAAGRVQGTNAMNAGLGQGFNFIQGNQYANALMSRNGVPNANYGQMSPGLNYDGQGGMYNPAPTQYFDPGSTYNIG
jgi:hypothetical protein